MELPPDKLKIAISFDTLHMMINCILKTSNSYKDVKALYKVYADNNDLLESSEARSEQDLTKWRNLFERFREKRRSLKDPNEQFKPMAKVVSSFTDFSKFDFSTFGKPTPITPLVESYDSRASTSITFPPVQVTPPPPAKQVYDFTSFGTTQVHSQPSVQFEQFVDFGKFADTVSSDPIASSSETPFTIASSSSLSNVTSIDDINQLLNEGTPEALDSARIAIVERQSLGLPTGQEYPSKQTSSTDFNFQSFI